MRFRMPYFPCDFEILDDWWIEAGMAGFTSSRPAYRSTTAETIALDDIEPVYRRPSAPRDWHGFRRIDLVSILKGFVADNEIPPIELLVLPPLHDLSGELFKYRVVHGYHRFYASIAAGFEFVPATTRGVWT
jgi:hypothetical protein